LGPHGAHDLDRLGKLLNSRTRRGKIEVIGIVLFLVPPSAQSQDEPPLSEVLRGRDVSPVAAAAVLGGGACAPLV
jgi:hypothetical protein